jgi:hypothetical protein
VIRITVIVLAVLEAGWMAFDGIFALIAGDYVTARGGAQAGQLGAWARVLVESGIDPRSTGVRAFFAIYGLVWLGATCAFAFGVPWMRLAMALCAVGALWYLPVGTLLSLVQLVLLAFFVS